MKTSARRKHLKFYLRGILCLCAFCINALCAHAASDDDIIEYQGDRYVIHVDRMHPDSEMTLLDVLNTCPEFLSRNGKTIGLDYQLRIDNNVIVVDYETILANVKACEIDRIQICSNTTVAKAVDGIRGVIDIYYREDIKTDGKVALMADTRGNGKAYADITDRTQKLTVQGYAMLRNSYGKAYPTDVFKLTDHNLLENLHLKLDWHISKSDRLIVKGSHIYSNGKEKLFNPDLTATHPSYSRYYGLIVSYSHTFRNDAILFAEAGTDYNRVAYNHEKQAGRYPYCFAELNTPLFTPDLWLMIGTEMDYQNIKYDNVNREQYLTNDFYAQFDYKHGPWVLTLGDRFRIMNFWNRQYDSADRSLWRHDRTNHSYIASAGFNNGPSFFQALFARRYYVPMISDFLVDETNPTTSLKFNASGYRTNLVHQAVLRYSFQRKNFFFHTSAENTWFSHLPGPNRLLFGFRNSAYWKIARWELTFGANYYHQHTSSGADSPSESDNFVTLKLAPVLDLPHGFRLSSVLLYSSRRPMENLHAHLFGTVKVNKQFGKKFNVYAEFHDLGGYADGTWTQLADLYQNRAVSIGATFYPFRK